MPFIIQCPYADCAKFMLVEDSDRGSTVKCLVCKRSIKLDPSQSGNGDLAQGGANPQPASTTQPGIGRQTAVASSSPGGAANPAAPASVPAAQRQNVRTCPQCSTPLKAPPGSQNQRIRCPRCKTVF